MGGAWLECGAELGWGLDLVERRGVGWAAVRGGVGRGLDLVEEHRVGGTEP